MVVLLDLDPDIDKARIKQAVSLHEEAAACTPADATERFDLELARSELAD